MPLFNILIRTSDRPRFFEQCVRSVEAQTFKNWRIIVGADNGETEKYVSEYPYEYIPVYPKEVQCFWNLYLNELLDCVHEGWVIYLDDDVTMIPEALETISQYADGVNKVVIWKYQFQSGRVIPEQPFWKKRPVRKHFDTGCFTHHSKQKVIWDGARASDFRVLCQLYDRGLRFVWVDKVLFIAGNNGDIGKKNDLILSN